MDKSKITRINELAKKSKTTGLTETEKSEQQQLRDEYRRMFRKNLIETLDNAYTVSESGVKEKLIKSKDNIKGGTV